MWKQIVNPVQRNAVPMERFDGIRAIQMHLNQRFQVEAYVQGYSSEKPELKDDCGVDCMVGKWLHGESGKLCSDVVLLNDLHESCYEFHEAASQALLLVELGKREAAMAIVRGSRFFQDASDRYQSNLAKLHLSFEMA
jgi:hypothetical protein